MIIQRTNVSLLPSLCYKAKRTVGFSPMAYNGYALAHPKGLVAFLPLKINKEKKQLPTNAVLNLGF